MKLRDIGSTIKKRRILLGLSRDDMSLKLFGVKGAITFYTWIEENEVTIPIDWFIPICQILGLSIYDFIIPEEDDLSNRIPGF